jgi:hypothetical protein
VNLPTSFTELEAFSFYSLGSKLDDSVEITINGLENVTSIGDDCFAGSNLKQITFNNLTKIGKLAFEDCKKLNEITINGKIISIGSRAFYNCVGLTKINFTNSNFIESIGDEAFYDCTSLNTTLYLPSTVSIGKDAFRDANGNKLSGISINYIN